MRFTFVRRRSRWSSRFGSSGFPFGSLGAGGRPLAKGTAWAGFPKAQFIINHHHGGRAGLETFGLVHVR